MASENCSICHNKIAVRQLPCKHEYCIDCIRNMIATAGRSDHLSCPNCRSLFSLTIVPKDSANPHQYIKEKYKQEIKAAKDVGVIQCNETIKGMTVIGDELFIVCKSPPNVIFKYDIGPNCKELWIPVELCISDMKWPSGIAGSQSLSHLYITDWHKMFGGRLWRYKYKKGQDTNQEGPVAIFDEQPFGVSVTQNNNLANQESQKTDQVVVTCANPANIFVRRGWIYIYQSSELDFQRITKIELPDLQIPRHSILTGSSKLIVCHGWLEKCHGVTSYLYDEIKETRKKSFYGTAWGGGSGEQEMNRPLSMIQDEDNLILVVDYYNHRIQLLTEDLQLVRHLITSGITYPRHVCLHAKTGRMYVGQWNGTVHIFDALIV